MDFLPKINYTYLAVAVIIIIIIIYLYKRRVSNKKEKLSQKKKSKVPVIDNDTEEDDTEEDKLAALSKVLYKKLHKDFVNDNVDVSKFNKISKNKVNAAVFTELTTLYDGYREKDEDFGDIDEKAYLKIIKAHVV